MSFKKRNRLEVDNMSIEEYMNYYEDALLNWNKKKVSDNDMGMILDEFGEKAYTLMTFLMGCCQLSSSSFRGIKTNLLAFKLELDGLKQELGDNRKLDCIYEDLNAIVNDIQDMCDISINGLDGTFRKEGESYLRELAKEVAEENNFEKNNFVINIPVDGISNIISSEDIQNNLVLEAIENPRLYDSKYKTYCLGEWDIEEQDNINTSPSGDENKKSNNFYSRVIDQDMDIDVEFKSLNELRDFVLGLKN